MDKEREEKTHVPQSKGDAASIVKRLLDVCFSYLYLGPLVVVYWFSTWMLCTTVIFSGTSKTIDLAVSAGFGYSVGLLVSCAQGQILQFTSRRHVVWQFIIKRCYSYVHALGCVCQWRAIWDFLDLQTGVNVHNALVSFLVPVALFAVLRCSHMLLACPALVEVDTSVERYFTVSTYFSQQPGTLKGVGDSLVTCLILSTLMVCAWRGLWELGDLWLLPDDYDMSAVYSLVLSYALIIFLLASKKSAKALSVWLEQKHFVLMLLFEQFVVLLHFVYVIFHWRGLWLLLDKHFLEPPLRYWVCHFFGFGALALSFASNSLIARGCPRDGEKRNGQGIEMDQQYVTALSTWCQGLRKIHTIPVLDGSDAEGQNNVVTTTRL